MLGHARSREPLWRLAVNGVTGFGMLAALAADGRAEMCPCGHPMANAGLGGCRFGQVQVQDKAIT